MHSLTTRVSKYSDLSVCVQQSNTLTLLPVYLPKKKSFVQLFVILVLSTNNKKGSQNVLQGTNYVPWVNLKWTV